MAESAPTVRDEPAALLERRLAAVRRFTLDLAAPLSAEDCQAQSMTDASPVKWHLAHTTWFFEAFVLRPSLPDYAVFHPRFDYLFNSYYNSVGAMHPRPQRGLLTRPSLDEVCAYRAHVDDALRQLWARGLVCGETATLLELGLNHEQQHQELILTDVKHLLAQNALQPAYRVQPLGACEPAAPLRWVRCAAGDVRIGAQDTGFAFDNERPRHRAWLAPYRLASRPVTNGEFREFVEDGGYEQPLLWLADGWAAVQAQDWRRPLYWSEDLEREFTLHGTIALDHNAPVCHLSYYEADAYARWAGARLPTEAEWEAAAAERAVDGHFADGARLHPAGATDGEGLQQLFGDLWEWSASPYVAYPGYRPPAGAVGEYNGKFMCNQVVLRGGSCATPPGHVRASYRNFFYPDARWQFSGLRLARD